MSRPMDYCQQGEPYPHFEMPFGASEVVERLSGKYVKPDTAGYIEMIDAATDENVIGWVVKGDGTTSSTDGGSVGGVCTDYMAVFEMPCCGAAGAAVSKATLDATMGEVCDFQMVSTNFQYADLTASTYDQLIIVGTRYYGSAAGFQSVLVHLEPLNLTQSGVA